jgi:hypothetical protein
MTDEQLIEAIRGHESLAPSTSQQLLDLGQGIKPPALPTKPDKEVDKQIGEMESRVLEFEASDKLRNPPSEEVEPSVKPMPLTPAGLIVGDAAQVFSDIAEGDFLSSAASILTSLPGVPDALKEPLEAIFIAASRVKSKADLDDISKLAKEGKFKELREKHEVTVGKDDIPRVEVDDSEARFNARNLRKVGKGKLSLNRVVEHPTLFAAVPELRDMDIRFDPNATISSFSGEGPRGLITVAGKNLKGEKNLKEIMSSLIHETQHAVQKIEGFDRGTGIRGLEEAGFNFEDAATLYFAASGEVEARDAARRYVKGRAAIPALSKERIGESAKDAAVTHEDLVPIPFDEIQRTPELKAGATANARLAAEEIRKLARPTPTK